MEFDNDSKQSTSANAFKYASLSIRIFAILFDGMDSKLCPFCLKEMRDRDDHEEWCEMAWAMDMHNRFTSGK